MAAQHQRVALRHRPLLTATVSLLQLRLLPWRQGPRVVCPAFRVLRSLRTGRL